MSVYNKKLIISEQERKEILSQYNLINLLQEADVKVGESVTTKITFTGGKYLEASGNFKDLTDNITAIKDFCNKVPNGKIVEVVVEAGESQIPNTDNETGGARVDVGYLSDKRSETIKAWLQKKFTEIKSTDKNFKTPQKFVYSKSGGTTPWVGQLFCPKDKLPAGDTQGYACLNKDFDPGNGKPNWVKGKDTTYAAIRQKYLTEQFVKVTFRLAAPSNVVVNMPPKLECLSGMIIEYNYDAEVEKSNNGTASNVHCCSRGLFTISVDGFKLKRSDGYEFANINNHPQYKNLQKKQPDSRPQNEAGVSNYYIDGGDAQPLCVHVSDSGKNQYTSVATYVAKKPMDNYRYNTFKISPQLAKSIVDLKKGTPGLLNINVTANDPSNTHTQAARIIVKDPKGNVYYDSCVGGNCGNRNTGDFKVSYCNTGFTS
jgi:hypothetical protein